MRDLCLFFFCFDLFMAICVHVLVVAALRVIADDSKGDAGFVYLDQGRCTYTYMPRK